MRIFILLFWLVFYVLPLPAVDNLLPPQNLIYEVSEKIRQELKKRKDGKISVREATQIVETFIEPHVDFNRFAALVLGKHWRRATPEQRRRFKEAFKEFLIRTYAVTHAQYVDWRIRFLPIKKWHPDAEKIIVRTEFYRPGADPMPVYFRMVRRPDGWKVYDVIIEGVSLVKNYRTSFTREIERIGLEGLISKLEEHNRKAAED